MRAALLVPALALTLACGSSKLSRSEAESDIRKDYPVTVMLRIPEKASAPKGSPEHTKLVKLQEAVAKPGWFASSRSEEGDREAFRFTALPGAPKDLRTAPKGWELPVAEAVFVKATGLEPTRDGAKVAYQVRLANPTPHFPAFQAVYGVPIGDTKTRHAVYRKEGRSWVLQGTDEAFKKAE